MFTVSARRLFSAGLGLTTALLVAACPAAESSPETKVDPRLKAIVDRHLRIDPNYRPGDLITRGNVESIFGELIELGVQPVDNTDGQYAGFLRDGDYLAQSLRSPQGRPFMRKVAAIPGAYDFLERLAWTPTGRSWIGQLIAAENGDELFAGLITAEGRKKVAEALGAGPQAENLGLPTGHVHTEAELLARLQRSLEAQARRADAKP